MKPITILLATLLLAAAAPAATADDDEPLEPLAQDLFVGETAFLQERREIQLTLLSDLARRGRRGWRSEVSFGFEYGLSDRVQFEATASGLSDGPLQFGEIGFSFGLVADPRQRLSFGLSLELEDEDTAWEPRLSYVRQVGAMQLHAGLAASLQPGERSYEVSLAGVQSIGRFSAILELAGRGGDSRAVLLAPGGYYRLGGGCEIGLGVPVRLAGTAPGVALAARFIWEF